MAVVVCGHYGIGATHIRLKCWLLQEPHVQRDKERLAKKLDAPKETFVMPEVAKYDRTWFHLLLF